MMTWAQYYVIKDVGLDQIKAQGKNKANEATKEVENEVKSTLAQMETNQTHSQHN